MDTALKQRKRPGPKPKGLMQAHLMIKPDDYEWAKDQPEGFGLLVRLLIAAERKRRSQAGQD
jgi:hypothetical protein